MRVALIPLRTVYRAVETNLHHLDRRLREVRRRRPDLVCLPECTLTGYLYEPGDLARFAETVPGRTTAIMGRLAREGQTWLCFGLIEGTPEGIYNTAVLVDREGEIRLVQRKIHEQPPFAVGQKVETVDTEWGRWGVLICGDLFSAEAVAQVAGKAELLIVPMARSFAGRSPDRRRWEQEERQVYLDAVAGVGVPAVIVNALEVSEEEPSFGGALVVGANGALLAESPHGTDEVVVYDF